MTMHLPIDMRHNILRQCHGNSWKVEKICYMLIIDILKNEKEKVEKNILYTSLVIDILIKFSQRKS